MSRRVEDRVAFITGVARGQGRSHALRLSQEGARIVGMDICRQMDSVQYPLATAEDLTQTVEMVAAHGGQMIARQGDVRSFPDVRAAVADGLDAFGCIDLVCVNAGIASTGLTWELTEEQWTEMIDVNLTGAWNTVRAVVPSMIAAGRTGSIVFIGSVAGSVGRQRMAHYAAAKHGLVGLMRTLANELAPYRIRVNSIHPTNVDTPMIRNDAVQALYPQEGVASPLAGFTAAVTALNALPVPWVESSDVSDAVLWLASDEARYVTGIILPVDAGAAIKSS